MTVFELNREQLEELKINYYSDLVNEGTFAEIMGCPFDEPSYEHIIFVNDYISDAFIMEHYEGVDFTKDDFFCTCGN